MNARFIPLCLALTCLMYAACTPSPEVKKEDKPPVAVAPTDPLVKPSEALVEKRVNDAQSRLSKTPEGKLVWEAIEAQGGLKTWFAQGPIAFRFAYKPVGGKKVRDTYQVVDTWSSRAKHQMANDRTIEFGWDGNKAWKKHTPEQPFAMNPRFWSLTPYYFVALPFVLADPGVNLKLLDDVTIDDKTFKRVKVTYNDGVGDSPKDYYIVHIEPDTKRMRALNYVVTYEGFFPNGGQTPEKLMYYDGDQTINGITLPTSYRTFSKKDGVKDQLVTNIELTEVKFVPEAKDSEFQVPEGATVIEGMK